MIAITLVAGAAVFGFVNGQAGVSEGQYNAAVANNANYLREHFEVVNAYYSNSGLCLSGPCFSISLYNNGAVGLTISQITVISYSTTSANNLPVPPLKVIAFDNGTEKAYDPAGAVIVACTTTGGAMTSLTPTTIGENVVPPKTFTVTIPTSCGSGAIVDSAIYTVAAVGLYGNVVQTNVEANW